MNINNLLKNLLDLLLADMEIDLQLQRILRLGTIYKAKILRNNLVEDQKTKCSLNKSCNFCSIRHCCLAIDINGLVKSNLSVLVCKDCLIHASEMIAEQIHRCTEYATVVVGHILEPDQIIQSQFALTGLLIRSCEFLQFLQIIVYGIRYCYGTLLILTVCQLMHGQIIYTKDHILRRNGYRSTIRRL